MISRNFPFLAFTQTIANPSSNTLYSQLLQQSTTQYLSLYLLSPVTISSLTVTQTSANPSSIPLILNYFANLLNNFLYLRFLVTFPLPSIHPDQRKPFFNTLYSQLLKQSTQYLSLYLCSPITLSFLEFTQTNSSYASLLLC